MGTNGNLDRCLRALDEFRRNVAETSPDKLDCVAMEREAREKTEAIGRELMKEVLERADTAAPQVTINGKIWGNRRVSKGSYESTFGEISCPRSIYSQSGGGAVAVPLDLRLGIHEGRYTPQMARVLNRFVAVMPAEEAEGVLKEIGVAMVSRSTAHRLPRLVGARYETRRESIQEEVRATDDVPEAAVTVQAALDGVMVPEDGEHAKPRGRTPKAPKQPQPPRHELHYESPIAPGPAANDGEVGRSWHEASVGTISYWDKDGEHLKTTYFARMPESGKGTLADEVEGELHFALARRPDLHVQFAADGDAHQWSLLGGMAVRLPETAIGGTSELLDFYHAAEYVKLGANAVEGKNSPEAHVLFVSWCEMLKYLEDGPGRVIKAMRYHRDQKKRQVSVEDLETAINYLAKQASMGRMAYAATRAAKRPIGTGVVEAGAKTVVGVRMKRAGARFSQHGGQVVMIFRTALLSGRFDQLSECLKGTYMAVVQAA
jgi:hypothetical protein